MVLGCGVFVYVHVMWDDRNDAQAMQTLLVWMRIGLGVCVLIVDRDQRHEV